MRLTLVFLAISVVGSAQVSRYARSEPPMTTDQRIATLELRLKEKPQDAVLMGRLASAFLQKMRETTDFVYLDRASSLVDRILTADSGNYQARRLRLEIAMHHHRFPQVPDYATDLLETNPSDSGVVGLLGDALIELGRYDEADKAYQRMVELAPGLFSYNRVAWLRFIQGKPAEALQWMAQAVASGSPVSENVAWVLVEYGDLLVKTGHPKEAREAYDGALERFPGYHRAHGALGRLLAAQNDLPQSVDHFKKAQSSVPFPEYAAALEELYRQQGNMEESTRQRNLVDAVERLMKANGEKANRTLALIYADRERRLERALEIAAAEFEVRQDVYSYDTYAWVLLKNGKIDEARKASEKALAMTTQEPLFYYHAGRIALAAGDKDEARRHLERAIQLSPVFDFVHAADARKVLAELQPPSQVAAAVAHD